MARYVQHITSRFGEMIDDNQTPSPAIEALISTIAEELCFVGRYDGKLGVILELELDDGVDMSDTIRQAWHQTEVPQGVTLATPQAGSSTYGIFNDRAALWAFVPAEIATYEIMKHLADEANRIVDGENQ